MLTASEGVFLQGRLLCLPEEETDVFFCGMKRHFGVVLKKSCIFAFSIRSEISLMLLVHIPRMTNRLGYTLNVLFRHLLRLDFEITVDLDVFERHDGPKLCYGRQQLGDGLFIRSCDLLFQTTIEDQQPRCFWYEEMPALYPVHNAEKGAAPAVQRSEIPA